MKGGPAKSWGHVRSAAAGRAADVPEEGRMRQKAVEFATQMKLMGRKPGGKPLTFESLDPATLMSNTVVSLVDQMNKDNSERMTKEFSALENKISRSFAVVTKDTVIGGLGENTAKELAESLGGKIISLKDDLTNAMHVSNSVQEILQLAIDKLQIWGNIVAGAIKEDAFTTAVERLIAQACAELEPIKEAKSLYEYMTKVHIPLCAEGHIKYYREKYKV